MVWRRDAANGIPSELRMPQSAYLKICNPQMSDSLKFSQEPVCAKEHCGIPDSVQTPRRRIKLFQTALPISRDGIQIAYSAAFGPRPFFRPSMLERPIREKADNRLANCACLLYVGLAMCEGDQENWK